LWIVCVNPQPWLRFPAVSSMPERYSPSAMLSQDDRHIL
jgi:hypothetical protein